MSALRLAHTRVRPYKTVSFSYFYERNLVLRGFLPPNDREPAFMTLAISRKADGGEGERRARGGLVTPGPQNEIG